MKYTDRGRQTEREREREIEIEDTVGFVGSWIMGQIG
jgi:hypothetical protein